MSRRRLPHRCCNGRGQHYSWCKLASQRAADKQAAQRRIAEESSAMFCDHANEVPMSCPCDASCYCKAHTCRARVVLTIDDDTRPVWEAAKRARAEVAAWPAWKRNEAPGEREKEERSWHDTWAPEFQERRR